MVAGNLLRMRVNQGRSEDYLEADRAIDQDTVKRSVAIICTGEREFCLAGGRDDLGFSSTEDDRRRGLQPQG